MGSGKIGSILKIGDFVRWSGEVIEKGDGFVWKELYDLLLEDRVYKIIRTIKNGYEIYYKLEDTYDHSTTPFYPEEVFYTNEKEYISEKYDLR